MTDWVPNPFRILITGSRKWPREFRSFVWQVLDFHHANVGPVLIWHGDCPEGVDFYGKEWAQEREQRQEGLPAAWVTGAAAGIRRNRALVDAGADLCLAFIYDGSPGASDCAAYARTQMDTIVYRLQSDERLVSAAAYRLGEHGPVSMLTRVFTGAEPTPPTVDYPKIEGR